MRSAVVGFILGGATAVVAANTIHLGEAAFNVISPPIPEQSVHVVHTPEKVVTHVETKTVYETKPLPDTCETVVDNLNAYLQRAVVVQRNGARIQQKMEGVTVAIMEDPNAVNDYLRYLQKTNGLLEGATFDLLNINSQMEIQMSKCNSDISKSNDGEDVPSADGLSGAIPVG